MLKKILLGLLILIVLLLGIGFLLPTEWEVERSIVINAPASAIYPTVADLKTWPGWTYWNRERDPDCEWSFEGSDTGAGAVMKWDGKVHMQGTLTIDSGDPATGIEYTLKMVGMEQALKGSIGFTAEGSATRVTWHDHGESDGMPWSNWMMLLLIDPLIGGFFEEGLANLKPLAEAAATSPDSGKAVEASAGKGNDKDKDKE